MNGNESPPGAERAAWVCLDGTGTPAAEPDPRGGDHVHSGQLIVAHGDRIVRTVLGSCVAVCLFDAGERIGGMNHYLMPTGGDAVQGIAVLRYARPSLERLVQELLQMGARRGRLVAKVFGGASVMASFGSRAGALGRSNAALAIAFLAEERIPIVTEETGGQAGRTIVFRIPDGMSWMRRLGTPGALPEASPRTARPARTGPWR